MRGRLPRSWAAIAATLGAGPGTHREAEAGEDGPGASGGWIVARIRMRSSQTPANSAPAVAACGGGRSRGSKRKLTGRPHSGVGFG
jgi:hypothetical protein